MSKESPRSLQDYLSSAEWFVAMPFLQLANLLKQGRFMSTAEQEQLKAYTKPVSEQESTLSPQEKAL